MIIPLAHRANQAQEYYFSIKLVEVRKLQAAGHDVINIGIGNPDMMPSEETIARLSEAARQPTAHGYQSYKGIPALRQAIARFYAHTYGVELDPETELLPMIGSKEAITHLSLTFLNEGDEVMVPELGYPAYRAVSQMVGAMCLNTACRNTTAGNPIGSKWPISLRTAPALSGSITRICQPALRQQTGFSSRPYNLRTSIKCCYAMITRIVWY